MLIPGLVSATFKKLNPDDVLRIASSCSLKAIEWSENHHIPLGDVAFSKEIKEKTLDGGLKIASYGSYYKLGTGMDFRPSLGNAIAMGAKVIRVWAGTKPSKDVLPEEYRQIVEEAKEISHMAGSEGVKVALEWHRNTLTDRNDSALRFLSDVGSDYFKAFWQPSPEMDVRTRKDGLRKVVPYLENIHVYYWDESGRRPLSEGISDWWEYLSVLDGRDHYALLEFVMGDSEEQFRRDAKTLLDIIDRE